jgi:hypothetical protein
MVAILHDAIGVHNLISGKCSRRGDRNKRLTIPSEAEKLALYGLPNFDDFQRIEFLAMTDNERSLAFRRTGLLARIYCLLQIGYFKAKQAFFRFSLSDVPPDGDYTDKRFRGSCRSVAPPACSFAPAVIITKAAHATSE